MIENYVITIKKVYVNNAFRLINESCKMLDNQFRAITPPHKSHLSFFIEELVVRNERDNCSNRQYG